MRKEKKAKKDTRVNMGKIDVFYLALFWDAEMVREKIWEI